MPRGMCFYSGDHEIVRVDKSFDELADRKVMSDALPLAVGSPFARLAMARPAGRVGRIVPRADIAIRLATQDDLPAIDALQKKESRSVGFLSRMALRGKIDAGEILVAERDEGGGRRDEEKNGTSASSLIPSPSSLPLAGYLIAADRYFKRDEVGLITAMNIAPHYRRSLVAAALLETQFARSAYGCRLYSCWCAQDLTHANAFCEAMGFTAIAYRIGGRKSSVVGRRSDNALTTHDSRPTTHAPRIHIFWQKRIREGDASTPWWYPGHTAGGAMRADRPVFPIPHGMHWSDELPDLLPEQEAQAVDAPALPAIVDEAQQAREEYERQKARALAGLMQSNRKVVIPAPVATAPILPPKHLPAAMRKKMMLLYEAEKQKADALAKQQQEQLEAEQARFRQEHEAIRAQQAGTGLALATGNATGKKQKPKRIRLSAEAKRVVRELRDHWGERIAPLLQNAPAKHETCRRFPSKNPTRSADAATLGEADIQRIEQADSATQGIGHGPATSGSGTIEGRQGGDDSANPHHAVAA